MNNGARQYSNEPTAIRSRRFRDKQKREREATAAPAPQPTSSSSPPLHESAPLEFREIPFREAPPLILVDASEAPENEDAGPAQVVPDAPPPPPPGVTPEEAKAIAHLVTMFVAAGIGAGLKKHPELVQMFTEPGPLQGALEHLPSILAFYEQTCERVAMKYQIRVPYMDEGIVVTGIGIAAWGFAGKPSKGSSAATAKNANVPDVPPSAPTHEGEAL